MITVPHNDRACLGAITEAMAARVRDRDPAIVAIADAHDDTADLADWIRALPQRDDAGHPGDGPKVEACEPAQRLRVPTEDPNCVERAALYLAAAELIDPSPVRQLATTHTPGGLHTYPLENGAPVVLDPLVSRNALAAGLFRESATRNGGATVTMAPAELVRWVADIAAEPAERFDRGADRIDNAHRAARLVMVGRPLCVADVRDIAFMLALADRESRLWGPTGPRLVATAAQAIDRLDRAAAERWQARTAPPPALIEPSRNAPELAIAGYRIKPDTGLLGALGRVGGRLGYAAGVEALRLKLAALGVGAPVLSTMERELQREGLTLGPLARPPAMLGSLVALTPEAIAGRWLASKL